MPDLIDIRAHVAVDGMPFGAPINRLVDELGEPDKAQSNYTGEVEMVYGQRIYRCLNNRLVECTIPDQGRFKVDDVTILSVFEWLAGVPGTVDIARFRISLEYGMAYDYRDPMNGSITLFERGRWDELVLNTRISPSTPVV